MSFRPFNIIFFVLVLSACSSLENNKDSSCAKKEIMYKGVLFDLNKEGIGASIQQLDDTFIISEIVAGGPVDKEGSINVGDKVIAISPNKTDSFIYVQSMSLVEVIKVIRGCETSPLSLMLERDDKSFTVDLAREAVSLK
ncbi:MAG: carboxyl-terminal processing protease [Glaciecola sp.]